MNNFACQQIKFHHTSSFTSVAHQSTSAADILEYASKDYAIIVEPADAVYLLTLCCRLVGCRNSKTGRVSERARLTNGGINGVKGSFAA